MSKKLLSFLLTLSVSTICCAGELTPEGIITKTYTSGGWTMLQINNQSSNNFGCDKSTWYAIDNSDSNYSGFLSSILAAQMSGKKVSFYVSGCGGQAGQYPNIETIMINS